MFTVRTRQSTPVDTVLSTAPPSISNSRLFASIRGWYFICIHLRFAAGQDGPYALIGQDSSADFSVEKSSMIHYYLL
jgi:hypothetical protein